MWLEALVILALVLVNAFFAMSELALVSSRPVELRRLAAAGRRGATAALDLIADPGRMLSAVQVGITLVGIVAGAYSGATLGQSVADRLAAAVPALAAEAEIVAMVAVIGLTTYLSLVVGELVPKRLALRHAETIAARVAPVMRLLALAGGPVIGLLRASTEGVLRLLGQGGHPSRRVTEDEVRAMIAEGALAGAIEPDEKAMLDRVMRLADRTAGSIMTPRPDVVWLDVGSDAADLRRRIAESHHSRLPLAHGDINNLIGILDIRLVLAHLLAGRPFDPPAATVEAPTVHEGTPVPHLLDLLRRHHAGMAVVLDEYGSLEGIITLADIMEAIAGELPEAGEEPAVIPQKGGGWLMDGGLAIEEVEAVTGLSGMGENGGFNTLAGFILARLARLPATGDRVEWQGWRFEVTAMNRRRIGKVRVTPRG